MRVGGSAHGAPQDDSGQSEGDGNPQHRLVLDVALRTLTDGRTTVDLSGMSVRLLRRLAAEHGVAVSKDDLIAAIYPRGTCGNADAGLHSYIRATRQALARFDIEEPIRHIHGFGFYLTVPVAVREYVSPLVIPADLIPVLRRCIVYDTSPGARVLRALVGA